MSWPGIVAPGTTLQQVVSNLDVFPTILDLSGLAPPDNLKSGRSLGSLLRGQASAPGHDTLFGQYNMHHYQIAWMRMVRTPEWKLVRHFEQGGQDELYHLAEDPGEIRDLTGSTDPKHRAQRARLAGLITEWMTPDR